MDATARGWVEVAAGTEHSCARDADGRITCWGNNDEQQRAVPGGTFTALDVVITR